MVVMIFALLLCASFVSPAFAYALGGSISGQVYFSTGNQKIPAGTTVSLVNASNVSDYIPGYNMTLNQSGFFQFLNIPYGLYKVYAWSPYYTEGYSAGINVTSNDTYVASVVLSAIPYYANITASTQYVRYQSQADITAQVADYWGNPVGSGWQILFNTTVGTMSPASTITDSNGKVYSSIAWVNNATPANITVYAISINGTSYPLQEETEPIQMSPSATPLPTVTGTPTYLPTAAPNATVTVLPATATPSSPTGTPTPTPGFEAIAALAAMGIVMAIYRHK
jgi:hypothetical protein